MTQDEIIRMAREAGAFTDQHEDKAIFIYQSLERFAALVAAHVENAIQMKYYGDTVRAMREEYLERAATIADSYRTVESRAIAEDIRSLK